MRNDQHCHGYKQDIHCNEEVTSAKVRFYMRASLPEMANRRSDFVYWGPGVLRTRPHCPITNVRRYWTPEEHELFVKAVTFFGHKQLKQVHAYLLEYVDNVNVRPKTITQIRTHHQKWAIRMEKERQSAILEDMARVKEEGDIELPSFYDLQPIEYQIPDCESVPETPSLQCSEEMPDEYAWLRCDEALPKEEEQEPTGICLNNVEVPWVRDSIFPPHTALY